MKRYLKFTAIAFALSSSAAFAADPGAAATAFHNACCALEVCCGLPCCADGATGHMDGMAM